MALDAKQAEPVEKRGPQASHVLEGESLQAWLADAGSFQAVVGINARNVDTTIVHVLNVVCTGLQQQVPGGRCLVVVCDGGSTDDTLEMAEFFPAPLGVTKVVVKQAHGPGKGNGVRTILEIARAVDAKACACVDGDLVSIRPEWMPALLGPALYGLCDLVVPYYLRDKWDGVITNHLCYPLTAALYGTSLRQPIGGDYGFSQRFIHDLLDRPMPGDFGIDIHITTTAVAEGHRIQEVPLGAKIHSSTTGYTDPGKSLSPMYLQVVGSLLRLVARYEDVWRRPLARADLVTEVAVPYYGHLPPLTVIHERSVRATYDDVHEHDALLARALPAPLHRELEGAKEGLDADLWARLVYAIVAWHVARCQEPDEEVLNAMGALGMGRFLQFIDETRTLGLQEAYEIVREQAEVFAKHRGLLVQRVEELR